MITSTARPSALCALLLLSLCTAPPGAPAQIGPAAPDSSVSSPPLKSKTIARGLSLGATAVPVGVGISSLTNRRWRSGALLTGGGLLLGPAAGLLYAEAPGRALRGIAWRAGIGAGSAALTVGGALITESAAGSFTALAALGAGIVGGICFVLAHSLYDAIATSAEAVEAHNASVRTNASQNPRASISVQPWSSPHDGTPGLQVRVSF